ncbi:hypothetical protein LX36DRAFT_289420 [Colletotrichum falcatum]|nr:hypothetical protein LX36DRAFT_289420 [Colletotrichum falcatum]
MLVGPGTFLAIDYLEELDAKEQCRCPCSHVLWRSLGVCKHAMSTSTETLRPHLGRFVRVSSPLPYIPWTPPRVCVGSTSACERGPARRRRVTFKVVAVKLAMTWEYGGPMHRWQPPPFHLGHAPTGRPLAARAREIRRQNLRRELPTPKGESRRRPVSGRGQQRGPGLMQV